MPASAIPCVSSASSSLVRSGAMQLFVSQSAQSSDQTRRSGLSEGLRDKAGMDAV